MKRPISTRLHGMIDYGWAAAASALARRVNGAATSRLLQEAAAAATANSLVTNYEAGAIRVMPMKAHLAADFALCTALLAAPALLPASERRYAVLPVLLGAAGLLAALLTKTRSPLEIDEEFGGIFRGLHGSAMAARDLDLAEAPHVRPHLE